MEKETTIMDFEPKEIVLPQLDLTKYMGIKTVVESVENHKGGIFKGKQSYYSLFKTKVLGKEGDLEIRATKLLGLQEDENGVIGWGKDTRMAIFLLKHKCRSPKEMIGKTVTTSMVENEKTGKEFLSFI